MHRRHAPTPSQHRSLGLGALLLGLLLLVPAAWASVNRDQAASIAQRLAPGRVLAVERGLYVDGSVVWRVNVLTAGGEVRVVVLDAATGRAR